MVCSDGWRKKGETIIGKAKYLAEPVNGREILHPSLMAPTGRQEATARMLPPFYIITEMGTVNLPWISDVWEALSHYRVACFGDYWGTRPPENSPTGHPAGNKKRRSIKLRPRTDRYINLEIKNAEYHQQIRSDPLMILRMVPRPISNPNFQYQ